MRTMLAAILVGYGGGGEALSATAAFGWVVLVDGGIL
jgi:hypothetical protein